MALTRTKKLELARELDKKFGPDKAEIVFDFGDGWTIRRLYTYGDMCREGELMSHCWSNSFWQKESNKRLHPRGPGGEAYGYKDHLTQEGSLRSPQTNYRRILGDRRYYSLRDADNLPRASFFSAPGTTEVRSLSYSHNSAGGNQDITDHIEIFQKPNQQLWP